MYSLYNKESYGNSRLILRLVCLLDLYLFYYLIIKKNKKLFGLKKTNSYLTSDNEMTGFC